MEVARWRVCQSPTAHDGMTRAARSAATPIAKKSHPATSFDPSDRANHPLVVTPTVASANAAAIKRIEATRFDGLTARDAVGSGVTGHSVNAVFAEEKPAGISDSEDGDSASGAGLGFALCRLRGLYARARRVPLLALLG